MSNEHNQHAGKDSLEAMHENDAHNTGTNDAVPGGAHAHSHAAHETGAKPHTKPAEDGRSLIAEEEIAQRLDRGRAGNR